MGRILSKGRFDGVWPPTTLQGQETVPLGGEDQSLDFSRAHG